jgi:putative phage-type endonuclease
VSLTAEQLEIRKTGIGGSEAAAVLGVSPWKTRLDVYLDKKGLHEEAPDPARELRMALGNETEAAIIRLWGKSQGLEVDCPGVTVRHERYPFMLASYDGLVVGRREGVEAKFIASPEQAMRLGEEGTDQALEEHVVQARQYLEVSGYERWHLIYGVPRKGIRAYVVEPHREFTEFLIDEEQSFWRDHVEAGITPAAEASEKGRAALARLFPYHLGPELLPASDELIAAAAIYTEARAAAKRAEEAKEAAAVKLEEMIGDGAGFFWPGGKATWKNDARGKPNYRALAVSLGCTAEQISQFTPTPGNRVLRVTVKE